MFLQDKIAIIGLPYDEQRTRVGLQLSLQGHEVSYYRAGSKFEAYRPMYDGIDRVIFTHGYTFTGAKDYPVTEALWDDLVDFRGTFCHYLDEHDKPSPALSTYRGWGRVRTHEVCSNPGRMLKCYRTMFDTERHLELLGWRVEQMLTIHSYEETLNRLEGVTGVMYVGNELPAPEITHACYLKGIPIYRMQQGIFYQQ